LTDEERQKLVAKLRWYGDRMERELSSPMKEAADEIERLAAELKKMGRWYNDAQKQLWAMKEKHGND
jgi:ribosome recycling factor